MASILPAEWREGQGPLGEQQQQQRPIPVGTGPASQPAGLDVAFLCCRAKEHLQHASAARRGNSLKKKTLGKENHWGGGHEGAAGPKAKCYGEFSVLFLAKERIWWRALTAAPCCCSPPPNPLPPPCFRQEKHLFPVVCAEEACLAACASSSLITSTNVSIGTVLSVLWSSHHSRGQNLWGGGQHARTPSLVFQMSR